MLRTILIPLDGSTLAARALPFALDLARRTGGAVHLIRSHVSIAISAASAEGTLLSSEMLAVDDSLRKRAADDTTGTAKHLADEWGLPVFAHAEDGSAGAAITAVADRVGADLIVMTTHGEGGFTPGWLGSVTDHVIRHSHRPVVALPEHDAHGGAPIAPRSILLTLDGSARSERILPAASELALALGARVELIRVISPYIPGDVASTLTAESPDPFGIDTVSARAKEALDVVAERLRKLGLEVTATLRVHLSPTRALLDHIRATDPDCVAIASQGRGFSRLFLGSVADKLVRSAGRPVLVLRPSDA